LGAKPAANAFVQRQPDSDLYEHSHDLTLERSSSILSRGGSGGGRSLQPPPATPIAVEQTNSMTATRTAVTSTGGLSSRTALALARGRAGQASATVELSPMSKRRQDIDAELQKVMGL
jgi:hypothetical protein